MQKTIDFILGIFGVLLGLFIIAAPDSLLALIIGAALFVGGVSRLVLALRDGWGR